MDDNSPKKHRPSFLYLDSTNIKPQQYEDTIHSADEIELTNITPQEEEKRLGPAIDHTPLQQIEEPANRDDQTVVKPREFAIFNNIIASRLDTLPSINHFFSIPEVRFTKSSENEIQMKQECQSCLGTYAQLIEQAESKGKTKEDLDTILNPKSAQKFAIFSLWIKAADIHGGSILIQKNENELTPIPVNYSNTLSWNPTDSNTLIRTTRWEKWPALTMPLDHEVMTFVLDTKPESTAAELKKNFFDEFGEDLPEEKKQLFDRKFEHLQANMMMVREGVKADLNLHQIMALILPEIDQKAFDFVTGGLLKGGELWGARERYLQLPTSFIEAWKAATQDGDFSESIFKKIIGEEIRKIKKLNADDLEKRYYHEICYELRRGLFL